MNALPKVVITAASGETIRLTKPIGKGGEGAVFEAEGKPDVAVKLYWPHKAADRRDKVFAMAAAQWYKSNSFVAFPIDVLVGPNGTFAGFVMKKIGGHKPVHLLFSPASRKIEFARANFAFLIRAANNIARAVASVHATGCVIGDLNHSGFLTSEQATSVLIDSDSFQVTAGTKSFLCIVGTPEYTPPEMQGSRFDKIRREPNHDNFGLAVLIFQLLFMGKHPFSGKFLGKGDAPPLERNIGEYKFAYSVLARSNVEPPPGAPLLADFPDYIATAFEAAFTRVAPTARPTAVDWSIRLKRLEEDLQECSLDPTHQHVKGKSCPWCRMESANPGFVAFNPPDIFVPIPSQIDIAKISAILSGIRDPGWLPHLESSIVLPTNLAPNSSSGLASQLRRRAWLSITASLGGAALVCVGGITVMPGLMILGGGLSINFLVPSELKKLREAKRDAHRACRSYQEAWNKQDEYRKYSDARREVDSLVASLSKIPDEERRGLQELEQKKREAQLRRHLDRVPIASAKIRKIGSGRKAVLASFGIHTAGDIDLHKIDRIQGFGPALVSELMSWKQFIASKFVFNPAEPILPADILKLKTQIGHRRAEFETKTRNAISVLQQLSSSIIERRRKILGGANNAYTALKQAELDEGRVNGSVQSVSKYLSLGCAVVAAVALLNVASLPAAPTKKTQPTAPISSKNESRSASTPATEEDLSNRKPLPPPTPAPVPHMVPSTPLTDVLPRSDSLPSKVDVPPLPPARDISPVSTPQESATDQTKPPLDLATASDATRVQQRLIELGYLAGLADGKWGPRSKAALRIFRIERNLGNDDTWDVATDRALFSSVIAVSNPNYDFVGGWRNARGQCSDGSGGMPLTITRKGAMAGGAFCEFNKTEQVSNTTWQVVSSCNDRAKTWTENVRLTLMTSELRWTSERGTHTYYRCY